MTTAILEVSSSMNHNLNEENMQTNLALYTERQLKSAFQPVEQETASTVAGDDLNIDTTTSLIYDLKKYKYDYFVSKLSCNFDQNEIRFGAPKGLCALNDDRLLVANFSQNSLLLMDIKGVVHHIYKNLPSPKDVLCYSSDASKVIVSTRKELNLLDLNTGQVITKSKVPGFYPWSIQHLKEHDLISACDPSSERIVYVDGNLEYYGQISFQNHYQQISSESTLQTYQKVYPYAAHIFPDYTSLVLTCCRDKFQVEKCNLLNNQIEILDKLPASLKSYSIHVDRAKNCIIPDSINHCLTLIDKDCNVETYKFNSIYEPYSMAILSTGTLCVTDHNIKYGTNGGIAILSEVDLKSNE